MTAAQNRQPFTVEGQTFIVPSTALGIAEGDRLAVAFFGGSACRHYNDLLRYSLEPGAVDLSLVRSGRCPLLLEHTACLEGLLGAVQAVHLERGILRALCRFATGGRADRVWSLLEQGFPISLSLGATVEHAVRIGDVPATGGAEYRITRWKLTELSAVPFGRDEDAHIRCLGRDEDPAEMVARMADLAGEEARAAVRRNLHLDRWQAWSLLAGVRVAERFGLDAEAACNLLGQEVERHCAALERDLAL